MSDRDHHTSHRSAAAHGSASGRGDRLAYVLGDLQVDTARQRVTRGEAEIALPKLSYDLLLALIESAPAVVSNDELMARVWPGLVVAEKTVNQRVKLLRDALGDDPQAPRYVAGLRGRGYRIAIEVAAFPLDAPAPPASQPASLSQAAQALPAAGPTATAQSIDTANEGHAQPSPAAAPAAPTPALPAAEVSTLPARESATSSPPTASTARRRTTLALLLLLALGCTGALLWLRDAPAATPATATAAAAPSAFSIAVLRFENQSGNPDNDYFAAGLTSEMSHLLARVRGLRVADASAAIPVTGPAPTAPELGTRLGVRWLLRGAVRESGSRIRISVELIRAEDAAQRWSEVYERSKGDIFVLQDTITAAVVDELKPRLEGEMPQARPTDADAYALYLRAHYLTTRTSPAGLSAALDLYRQALEIAPDYAAAWEGMARNYQQQAGLLLRPAREAFEMTRDASIRAIAADPQYGLAHARLGAVALLYDGDIATAARHMQHGYNLDPGHALTNGNLSVLLRSMGRIPEALAYGERADRMDPLNPRGMSSSAYLHIAARQFDIADARLDQTLQLSPDFAGAHYLRAVLRLLQDRADAALREAKLERNPAKRVLATALATHALGRPAEADAAVRQLQSLHAQGKATAYALACAHAWRGEHTLAFAWLERAAKRGGIEYDPDFAQLLVDPLLASLHGDPRWPAYLRRIGRAPEQLALISVRPPIED